MFSNLKNKLELLNNEERYALYTHLLGYDRTRFSKKLNGSYNKVNFTLNERKVIHNFLENKFNEDIDIEWLFQETEKEKVEEVKGPAFNDELPTRFRIAVERVKELHNKTERQIAEELNIDRTVLWNYKKGNIKIAKEKIDLMAKVLDVSPNFLQGKTKVPLPYEFQTVEKLYDEDRSLENKLMYDMQIRFYNEYFVTEEQFNRYNEYLNAVLRKFTEFLYYEIVLNSLKRDMTISDEYYRNLNQIYFKMSDKIENDKKEIANYLTANPEYKTNKELYSFETEKNKKWTYRTEIEKKMNAIHDERIRNMKVDHKKYLEH